MVLKIYLAESADVIDNIATECVLARQTQSGTVTLYLWSNDSAVVVGKHQLVAKECNYKLLTEQGGKVARRLSGGGAVYHDKANLCFSFITTEQDYNQESNYQIIINALSGFGLTCTKTGRNDIEIDGKKFSGNAYYTSQGVKVHHGTLLINTDVDKMQKYLTVRQDKLAGHGVDSVPKRVINLAQLNGEITRQTLTDAIINSAKDFYGNGEIYQAPKGQLHANYKILLSSNKWLYGFGNYKNKVGATYRWGHCEVYYSVVKGVMEALSIVTDCLSAEIIDKVTYMLKGACLPLCNLEQNGNAQFTEIYNDIISLIK